MKKALVLSLAAVLCLGVASFAESLFGTWDTQVCFDTTTCCPVIESDLNVSYETCGWTFSFDTSIDMTGITAMGFGASGSLGAFTIGSTLTFDPLAVAFDSWEVTGGLSLAGVTFDGTFTLEPGITTLEIEASGSAGCVDLSADLVLGGLACNFDFSSLVINADFPFACADIAAEIAFDCTTGFLYAQFCANDIVLPNLSWVTLDFCLKFTPEAKTYTITPNFDFGFEGCFDIYLSDPATIFGAMTIDGIGLEAEIGGVSFTGISYWGQGTKPGILKGTPYWEAYQIATTDDGCCGPFNFDIAVFFLEGGIQLFDIAEIDTNFDIQISTQFSLGMSMNIVLDPAPTAVEWCLNFKVEW